MSAFSEKLRAAGMNAAAAESKGALMDKVTRELNAMHGFQAADHHAYFVPGRIEVLGKHTDYAGGRSLVCAVERGICIAAAARADAQIHIVDAGSKSEAHLALDADRSANCKHWSSYAETVARRFARDFPRARTGAEVIFASDLPCAAGMSSSSALMIAIFFALAEINAVAQSEGFRREIRTREDLAGYLASIESGAEFASFSGDRGVGTLGGSEDHTAILCSRAGFLRQYSYLPTRLEREIPMPERHTFVIGVSGVKADKTGSARDAYNRASLAARKILQSWRSATGRNDASLGAALSSEPAARERLDQIVRKSVDSDFPAESLTKRLAQFAEESGEIVPAAGDALARGDLESFGKLVDRSEFLAEAMLGNQVPETIELARSARALGAVAASAFGAGFGGSVWALVALSRAEEFRDAWTASYRSKRPERAEAAEFFTGAGPGLISFGRNSFGEEMRE